MSRRPDWSEWVLQKNNEAKQEELKKNEFIEIDDLSKKVREPQISSPGWERAKYRPDAPHVEGAVKRKKYQGGDPRHEERMMQAGNFSHKTRSGQNREGGGQGEAFTSGVSPLRPKKHTDYEREEAEERVTGKKIKLNKSEDDLPDHSDWSEWILQKNAEFKQEELKKSEFVELQKAAKDMVGDDVDSSMFMSELESMNHHIEEIREHLSESDVAPDWVKAKVSKAAASISDIAHYVMGVKQSSK